MENGDNSIREDLLRMRGHQYSATRFLIPRIPERLRYGENVPYEPRIISFGPYHHGKPSLQAMEKYKRSYLDAILNRCDNGNNPLEHLEHFINMMKDQETEIRSWYPDYFDINSSKEFVKMMLLDGCFVVEYLLRIHGEVVDELNSMVWMHGEVLYDILLLENQIPFFILNKIFEVLPATSSSLMDLAISCLERLTKQRDNLPRRHGPVHHLLHLYHSLCLYTPTGEGHSTTNTTTNNGATSEISEQVSEIPSATMLQEAGIKFVSKVVEGISLDVTFSNGKMEIPRLLIDADTKSRLRNLVMFEQFYPNFRSTKSFCAFVDFISCLVTTPKEVALLHLEGIINTSYDHKSASDLLSQLKRGTSLRKDHYLAPMYGEVNKYWQNRKHTWRTIFIRWRNWRASLIDNYFSSPWKTIGIVTGGILLVLTLLQTIFSGYSTFQSPPLPSFH